MNAPPGTQNNVQPPVPPIVEPEVLPTIFSQEWVLVNKQELVALRQKAGFWQGQHTQLKRKFEALQAESLLKDAQIKDLQNRVFAKKSEKDNKRGTESTPNAPSIVPDM